MLGAGTSFVDPLGDDLATEGCLCRLKGLCKDRLEAGGEELFFRFPPAKGDCAGPATGGEYCVEASLDKPRVAPEASGAPASSMRMDLTAGRGGGNRGDVESDCERMRDSGPLCGEQARRWGEGDADEIMSG